MRKPKVANKMKITREKLGFMITLFVTKACITNVNGKVSSENS